MDLVTGFCCEFGKIPVGDEAILVLIEGMSKVDNKKFKNTFHVKAKMIPYDQVEEWIGHAPGGVYPFGIKEGVKAYLDESLKRFDTVYPAAGNDHSVVKLDNPALQNMMIRVADAAD